MKFRLHIIRLFSGLLMLSTSGFPSMFDLKSYVLPPEIHAILANLWAIVGLVLVIVSVDVIIGNKQ